MQSGNLLPAENPPAYEYAVGGTSTGMCSHSSALTLGGAFYVSLSLLVLLTTLPARFYHLFYDTAPLPGKNASPQDTQPKGPPLMLAGGPQVIYGATSSEPTVYNYQDPRTGQRVVSLLPPDHPQMVCLQTGTHIPDTRYGCLGAWRFSLSISSSILS